MNNVRLLSILVLMSCHSIKSDPENKNNNMGNNRQEAISSSTHSNYLIFKRHRLTDQSGFSQPVEATSFLLPENWQADGRVYWNQTTCFPEMVQATLQATSPDGYELTIFPTEQFDWADHPQLLDALQRGGMGIGCKIAQPLTADQYIRQFIAKEVNGTVQQVAVNTQLEEFAAKQLAAMTGRQIIKKPSIAEGILVFADGTEGIAKCALVVTTTRQQWYDGSTASHFQTNTSNAVVLKYPNGKREEAQRILATIETSIRVNPTWASAVMQVMQNIQNNIQNETSKRIQISQQAQQEISNNIIRNWEAKQQTNNNVTNAFNDYIKGVDRWTDADGNKIELSSGYSNAWQRADGSYLMSNDVSFDPNVAFNESWTPLKK